MADDRPPTFRYVNTVTGETIATGPLSLLNDQLAAQRTAEGAIRAAALAADESHRARADSLDRREAALKAREHVGFSLASASLPTVSPSSRRGWTASKSAGPMLTWPRRFTQLTKLCAPCRPMTAPSKLLRLALIGR
jgi:hypothetical protein